LFGIDLVERKNLIRPVNFFIFLELLWEPIIISISDWLVFLSSTLTFFYFNLWVIIGILISFKMVQGSEWTLLLQLILFDICLMAFLFFEAHLFWWPLANNWFSILIIIHCVIYNCWFPVLLILFFYLTLLALEVFALKLRLFGCFGTLELITRTDVLRNRAPLKLFYFCAALLSLSNLVNSSGYLLLRNCQIFFWYFGCNWVVVFHLLVTLFLLFFHTINVCYRADMNLCFFV